MGGAETEQAAVARRHPHRSAGVRAEGHIHQAAGHRGRRSARGSSRHPLRCPGIQGCALEVVPAEQAEGQLIGHGLAQTASAGPQQLLDADGVDSRGRMGVPPGGVAAAGGPAGDIDDVLDGERQPIEGAGAGGRHREAGHEGVAVGVAVGHSVVRWGARRSGAATQSGCAAVPGAGRNRSEAAKPSRATASQIQPCRLKLITPPRKALTLQPDASNPP